MMNIQNSLVLATICALCRIFPPANSRPSSNEILRTYHIVVINDMPDDGKTALNLHCKSSDDDLGAHVLVPHQSYKFGTKIDLFRTTMFACQMTWSKKSITYPAFKARRDEERCSKLFYCMWYVRADGIYFSNDNSSFYNAFPW